MITPQYSKIGFVAAILGVVSLFGAPLPAMAQEGASESNQGRILIQGKLVDIVEEELIDMGSGITMDYREEMRNFIQGIADYSRQHKPSFAILVEDGLDLLVKSDPSDETLVLPARAYARSIDGVMATSVFHGSPMFNQPPKDLKAQKVDLDLIKEAKRNGLSAFVLDKAESKSAIDEGQRNSMLIGAVYGNIPTTDIEEAVLPSYPSRPFLENSHSIVSLQAVKSFAVVGNTAHYGRQDEFAMKMHSTNYDMLVVDVFHGRTPLSKQAVETLKFKRTGNKRLVMARVNIGTASSYHYYWNNNWQQGSPDWIGFPVGGNPDQYFVQFWRPEWQRIITGDSSSFIYGILKQGYDGVILSGSDVYEIFEGGEAAESRL